MHLYTLKSDKDQVFFFWVSHVPVIRSADVEKALEPADFGAVFDVQINSVQPTFTVQRNTFIPV